MLLNGSHLVIATNDVLKISRFFEDFFELKPHFSNSEFCEFVLPSKFRLAFFKPVGKATKYFTAEGERGTASFGVTVNDTQAAYEKAIAMNADVSGPPKDHPWGEKSFLLIDPDGNRWEITQSPTVDGKLVDIP